LPGRSEKASHDYVRHGTTSLFDLWLEGERAPLGVTAGHPIWSADRRAWVPAGALVAGECVLGVNGPVRVLRTEERGDEPVLTLEVDGDHCFRVGEQGVLVHNASTDVMITLTPAQVAEFNSIAQFRLDLELPAAGSAADNQTIAKLHIKGRVFWGGNSGTLGPSFETRKLYNEAAKCCNASGAGAHQETLKHGEADALFQAYDKHITSDQATMYVDRKLCGFCRTNLKNLLCLLKMQKLIWIGPVSTIPAEQFVQTTIDAAPSTSE